MKNERQLKLVHHRIETQMTLDPNKPHLLIVENPAMFYSLVREMISQSEGQEGNFIWGELRTSAATAKKVAVITDWFNIDVNSKKIVAALQKHLQLQLQSGHYTTAINELNCKLSDITEDLFADIPFSMTFDEITIAQLVKLLGAKIADYDNPLEQLTNYIDVMRELAGCEIFVTVNVKSVLNDEELMLLYQHCANEQLYLLLVENNKCRPLLECERAVIITEDLCEIVENIEEIC